MSKFKVIKDKNKCEGLWNKFSPNKVLWDLWDVRLCFHSKNFVFYFILGYEKDEEVGLIPLVLEKKSRVYTYFGDTFPEQNKFFLKDKSKLSLFLKQCPLDTQIYYIDNEEKDFYNFNPSEKRYFLNFKKYGNDIENYLKTFTKKHRKNLRYDLKKLKEKNYRIKINEIGEFDTLVKFNELRFGKESNYNDINFYQSMKKLIDFSKRKNILHMITVKFNNKTEAIGIGIIYNKIYYVIGSGRNLEIKNLGKLLIYEQIMSALKNKCNEIDFLSTESKWKELWNFDSEQMYEFIN